MQRTTGFLLIFLTVFVAIQLHSILSLSLRQPSAALAHHENAVRGKFIILL